MTGSGFGAVSQLAVGNVDDGLYRISNFPFYFNWGGVNFTEVWVSTNSYVLFNTYMTPSYESAGPFSASNWNYPTNSKIFIGAADNSAQQVTVKTVLMGNPATWAIVIRYEGCSRSEPVSVIGQSDIIWEMTIREGSAYANKIFLDVILNGRITNDQASYSALCGGSTQLQAFVPGSGTSWMLELGANQSTYSISSLPYARKKKLVVSGGLGVMAIGDEDMPVGNSTFDGGAITDPETYRNQVYFHSNLPYLKIANTIAIPSITFPQLDPDYRTWADSGGGGCGGGLC